MNAGQAVVRSITHNEIVTIDWDSADRDYLAIECEDWVANGPVTEFWGTDADGDEWRVHLVRPLGEPRGL